ncbi:RidA family protein (plasmid) [Entomospira nematocerorum]|uniref:RidA family protein n=1 Tax=Entomospira nematocerorum TaxID=2719987 RepID=A0A968GDV7_9SPIO|nr:RidA family protein [Entomospira nematocera]NIZ47693.1 RidA family protein [Entomospira nematocera]WDI34668.1 RidA family protein [Entomospira nematocera]
MGNKLVFSDNAPAAIGPYAHAVEANGVLYVSGQIPADPKTGEFPEGIKAQTKQSLANVDAILKEAGYTKFDVVRAGIFVKDMNEFAQINEVYAEYFESHTPARATVEVARLPKDAGVEIDVIAVKAKQ